MAERPHAANFYDLVDNHIGEMTPGTMLEHGMLGIRYPSDDALSPEQLAAGVAEFARRVEAWTGAGIVVRRLVLGSSPEDPGYDPNFWRKKYEVQLPILRAGADIRCTDIGRHRTQLDEWQQVSPLAIHHRKGIMRQAPQSSYWAGIIPPDGITHFTTREFTWVMNYARDKLTGELPFRGGPIYDATIEPRDVRRWREYWRGVFDTSPSLELLA